MESRHWLNRAINQQSLDVTTDTIPLEEITNIDHIFKAIQSGTRPELEKLLSSRPSLYRYKDNFDRSLVHHAAAANNLTALEVLYQFVYDINGVDKHGNTPLHLAVEKFALDAVTFLLSNNAKVCAKNHNGNAPLHVAVTVNNIPALQVLIKNSKMLNPLIPGENGRTALHLAAAFNHVECAKILLSITKEFCLNIKCGNGYTPLHEGARDAAPETLEEMLKWGELMNHPRIEMMKYTDREGNNPLHSAIHGGNIKCVLTCLESGARMIAQQSDLSTALHLACSMGQLDIISLMFSMQPEDKLQCLYTCDAQNMMPLHYAAMFDHTHVVEYLLSEGANINAVESEHRSALLLAASKQAWNTVHLLLNKNADVSIKDTHGRNILHYVVMHEGFLEEFTPKLKKDDIRVLLNDADVHGCTPLHYATRGRKLKSTESLLRLGADINTKNNLSESPLHFAARYGRYNTVKKLLNGKSVHRIINEMDGTGKTALHTASENGQKKVVQLLLTKGALLLKDHQGRTPLHLAAAHGYTDTMELLLSVHALLLDQEDKEGNTPLHLAAKENHVPAISLLLHLNCKLTHNKLHQTPMDLVLIYKHSEAAMAMATHEERGSEILRLNCEKAEGVIQALIVLMPEVYVAVLDRCITKSHLNQDDENYFIKYSFKYLQFSREVSREMESKSSQFKPVPLPAMNTMVQYKRLELLSHPVCQKYIQMKWRAYGMHFHLANLFVYILFMALLTLYSSLLMSLVAESTPPLPTTLRPNFHVTPIFPKIIPVSTTFYLQAIVVLIFVLVNVLRELLQLYQQRIKYFLDLTNLVEWILYITALIMIHPVYSGKLHQMELASAAVAIFLTWFNFLLYLQRFDCVGIYVVMFLEILKTLVRALLIFSILFIAFALAFYILLSTGHHMDFSNFPISLIRVFSMMLGEFDILGTFIQPYLTNEHNLTYFNTTTTLPYPFFSFGFLLLFMISMPILLVNLLIGLAVGDIESVRRNAYLKRLAMQVDLHTELERTLPRLLLERVDKIEVKEYPNAKKKIRCVERLSPIFQKWFGNVYTNSSEKLLQYSEAEQQDDYMYEEMYKQRQKIKEVSTSLDNIHKLVRLVVEKMEIQTESSDWDEGEDSRRQRIRTTSNWTSPAFRRKVKAVASLMRRARDPSV